MEYAENQSWKLYLASEITKREYFAGLAMQGFCANSAFMVTLSDVCKRKSITEGEAIAQAAIQAADALLHELEKE